MNVRILMALLTGMIFLSANHCLAGDGWQANLTVSSGNASSKLTFGQNTAATDLNDGFYDVPALLSGSLQAAFTGASDSLWRDIKALTHDTTGKEWRLHVGSDTGQKISIGWDQDNLPEGMMIKLVDIDTGNVVDMKLSSSYTLQGRDGGELIIEVSQI